MGSQSAREETRIDGQDGNMAREGLEKAGWIGWHGAYRRKFSGHAGAISIEFQRFSGSFFPLLLYFSSNILSNFSNGSD